MDSLIIYKNFIKSFFFKLVINILMFIVLQLGTRVRIHVSTNYSMETNIQHKNTFLLIKMEKLLLN